MRDKTTDKLDKALEGWTVTAVYPNPAPEGMIILSLKKDGQRRKVRLWATDLGWWFKADKTKGRKST